MEKKLYKPDLSDQKVFTSQDSWQAHYQILLKISLEEFIKLNINMDMIIKHV